MSGILSNSITQSGIDYLKKIDKLVFNFVWQNKPVRIRGPALKNSLINGGASMPDLILKDDCLKLSWLQRLMKNTGAWKQPVLECLKMNENVLQYYLTSNIKFDDLPDNI